jgi:endonuclease/exonuclease/phosphatase (EEP) superfamily protein YafD
MNTSKKTRTLLAVTLLGALASQGALACKAPKAPAAFPDGRTAQVEVMQEAKRNVEAYFQQVATYMQCENDALKLQEAKARQTEVLNAFNAQVRAFKAVNSPMMAATYR